MIFRSPYPDVGIPHRSVFEHVLGPAAERGAKPALVDGPGGATTTYAELVAAVRRAASGLRALGLTKGDVVAIQARNGPRYPVAFHAIAAMGGVTTPLNPLSTADEIARQLTDSGARLLITEAEFVDTAHDAAARAGVDDIVSLDAAPGTVPWDTLLDHEELREAAAIDPDHDLAVLPYSSGTTGVSKGVMLTHRNLVANMVQLDGISASTHVPGSDDVVLAVLPFFHIYGLLTIMNSALARGARVVTLPKFELEPFLAAIERYRVTLCHVVPPILLRLAQDPAVTRYDLSSLTYLMSGAAPLGAEVAAAAAARVGCTVAQGYGLTETSPVTHACPSRDPADVVLDSIGPCLPNTEIRLVDPASGEDVGTDRPGELWVRGPQVMKGYLGRPDATAATIDADGWLHTGDIARADDNGFFYVVDRVKELIKFKGFPVAPAELEALLLSHPAIRDAAVVRCADAEAGEVPKAFVVRAAPIDAGEVMAFVAARVAPHKKVRRVAFVDEIPKSASGKILRRLLAEP